MSFRSALVAASVLLATANAHMIMKSPVPYSKDKLDNGPITAEQFPCKSQNGFTVTTMNQMAVGESQKLTFEGSAVHGGGSCQLSYTQDTEPTKDSVFKVIKSIEGGCPGVGGPEEFDFKLPDSIPNGKGTFAWTWFAKLSGAPEMYMNCAPIEVTGGASDTSGLGALPDMLVANLASSTCKSPLSQALKFPNPGSELQTASTGDVKEPTGECGASGNTPPSSPGDEQPSKPSSSAAYKPSASAGGPTAPAPEPTPTATPSSPGGIFAPGASGASSAQTRTTMLTVTGAPSGPTGTGAPAQPTGYPSGGQGESCSEQGAIMCNGTDKFGLCNNGSVVWQSVSPGTTCSNGSIQKRGYNGRIARPRAAAPARA
jgi:hypothetical protein